MTRNIVLSVIIIISFMSCDTVTGPVTIDTIVPTFGSSGAITTASVESTSLTLNWTAGSDDTSAPSALEYLVYRSTSNNITSVDNMEANGTAIGNYAANIIELNVTGLTPGTTYYFNLIVKDEAGNQTAYSSVTQATTAAADAASPTAGNSGTITTDSVESTSLTLNWTAGTDDTSTQSALEYLVYRSTNNDITSIANMEGNGTAVGTYTANIATVNVTGLTAGTTYYFNLIVRDEAGNKRAYTPVSQSTPVANILLAANTWTPGTLAAGESVWYFFDSTAGTDHIISWDDAWDGSGSYTLDVAVSAFREDGTTSYFSNIDSGFSVPSTLTVAAGETTVYIKVDGYEDTSSGTFRIHRN